MIDEKKIEKAAKDTYNQLYSCYGYEEESVLEGFKEGAHWAIEEFLKGLWNDAKDEPQGRYILACHELNGAKTYALLDWPDMKQMLKAGVSVQDLKDCHYSSYWNLEAEEAHITKWCDIDFLLSSNKEK